MTISKSPTAGVSPAPGVSLFQSVTYPTPVVSTDQVLLMSGSNLLLMSGGQTLLVT